MTGTLVGTPRFTARDLETASIRSAAPSYVSDVPSYHSTAPSLNPHNEVVPAYTPRTAATSTTARPEPPSRNETATPRQQTLGLPPVPAAPAIGVPSLHNFRLPTWSTNNALASRHYQNVAERRVMAGRSGAVPVRRFVPVEPPQASRHRPLEDPYLVGEHAAAMARRDRLAREAGDDILIREDRQWDWWLARMKDSDERERSETRVPRARHAEVGQRKKLLHRIGGRILA
ncbi:hypothetical protein S40285_05296 [Stachybotrys chlorohalonatus IBT 40285]|uniref:Uncharacterized protein n=1 Tax=Stachybotrys chlorohalonatus (strain IBT 40285) TaxID=1283841 RepID=A0A084QS31_STAC4|nr:hypothetical protein S40285_05296 [Stachybotrys chlorohalonata IBT 40285]